MAGIQKSATVGIITCTRCKSSSCIILNIVYNLKLYFLSYFRLKRSKSDGNYGFKSDHLINGGKRLHILLSMLFRSMLIHGYNANDLVLSSIISIPKDIRSSLSSSDNYRGISLFNGICKLFDYVIMHTCNDYLYTSDMQFGLATTLHNNVQPCLSWNHFMFIY